MVIRSLRWRLQLWYGLLLFVVLTAFGLTLYRLEQMRQLRQVDAALQQRVNALLSILRPLHISHLPANSNRLVHVPGHASSTPPPRKPESGNRELMFIQDLRLTPELARLFPLDEPRGYFYALWSSSGKELARSTNTPGSLSRPHPFRLATSPLSRTREEWREMLQANSSGMVLVGCSLKVELADWRKLTWRLISVGGIVLLCGLAGGWWLATRAIAPIQIMSATAGKIAAGDLSQRIKLEDTESELGRLAGVLNSTFARLEAAFTQQGRFTADAAHELRTPVTVLLTQIQTALARPRDAAQYQTMLETCLRNVQRMRRLIESLLELARFDSGQESLRRVRFDLTKLIHECLELIRPLAEAKGISIRMEVPELYGLGDSDRLTQVILNLLTNAIQYNRDNGQVQVSAEPKHDQIVITVSDQGRGIAPRDLPHIFERFYRADLSRAAARGQTGLGLAISKAIVEAHGGSITVTSVEGADSTFTVCLPMAENKKGAGKA